MAIGLPGVPDFGHCSFGKLGDAVQCFSICVHLTRKRHSACEQSNEARKLCPATDSGPIRPILKSVHFTKPPLFTFRLTRTRHSACEQSNEARKLCPATGWFRLNAQNCVPGNSSRRFFELDHEILHTYSGCLLYTSPSPRDKRQSRMPSSA